MTITFISEYQSFSIRCMRFGNRKLRQQQSLQYELEKNKAELEEYREELVSHFARSAELLDNMHGLDDATVKAFLSV